MSFVSEDKDDSTKCNASDSSEDIQLVKTNSIFRMSQRSLSLDHEISNVMVSPRKTPPKAKALGIHDGHPVALSPISHSELGRMLSQSTDSADGRGKHSKNVLSPSNDPTHVSHLRSKLGKSISDASTFAEVIPDPSPDEHHEKVHNQNRHGLVNRVRSLSEDAVAAVEPDTTSSDVSPLSDNGQVDNIVHLEALSAFSFDAVDTGRVISRSSSVDNHSSGSGSPRRGHHGHQYASPVLSHSKHALPPPHLAPINLTHLHHQHHHESHHTHHGGSGGQTHHGHGQHHHHAHGQPPHLTHLPDQAHLHQGRPHPPYTAYHPHSATTGGHHHHHTGGVTSHYGGEQLVSKGLMDRLSAETQAEHQRKAEHKFDRHFGDGKTDDFQVHYKNPVELVRDKYYDHNIVESDEDEGKREDDVYYY